MEPENDESGARARHRAEMGVHLRRRPRRRDAAQRDLLGGKGAYLAEMSRLGLPVPPGLTISSEVCTVYYRSGKMLPAALMPMVSEALDVVGKVAGARFGDVDNPLLVSVRSGSRASMPGMMDTVLNLGLNDETVEGLARRSSDRRFAYDTYRRFIQMYGDVVLGIDHYLFEEVLENYKSLKGFELELGAWSRALGGARGPLQGPGRAGAWPAFPAGSARSAVGRDRRGVRLLAQRSRHRLPAAARHPRRLGHRGHRASHGVRQYGRAERDRRRVHPQSFHRGKCAVRRVPGECPRRGRGRWAPYAATLDRGSAESDRRPPSVARGADA